MIDALSILDGNVAGKQDGLRTALVEKPAALASRETVQIVLVREVQDYAILRTEETRELNTVWTQDKVGGNGEVERVAFLATKQKGAESRELESLLRTWNGSVKRSADECYLKSQLCMKCPRCVLFGATDVSGSAGKGANIKHRIAYATAFSLLPVDPNLRETHTFNGVDGATQLTGQTLGARESVRPGALFASIVTLRAATEIELVLTLKTLLSCTRYGAETRIGGIVRNHVVGVVAAQEEILSPLELTLRLGGEKATTPATVQPILMDYGKQCGTPKKAHVLASDELAKLVQAVQDVEMTKDHLDAAYKAAEAFRGEQGKYLKKTSKKGE
jgi:CRISPR type I-D-associated protein Csc2